MSLSIAAKHKELEQCPRQAGHDLHVLQSAYALYSFQSLLRWDTTCAEIKSVGGGGGPELSKVLSLEPAVGHNIALPAPPISRNNFLSKV